MNDEVKRRLKEIVKHTHQMRSKSRIPVHEIVALNIIEGNAQRILTILEGEKNGEPTSNQEISGVEF